VREARAERDRHALHALFESIRECLPPHVVLADGFNDILHLPLPGNRPQTKFLFSSSLLTPALLKQCCVSG
jgi:hypothetical protein